MTERPQCEICHEFLEDFSDYEGLSGHSAEWWATKALYEHVDERHS